MSAPHGGRDRILATIALFKFVKATVLIALGIGAHRLLDPVVAERVRHAVEVLVIHLHKKALPALEADLLKLTNSRLELFSVLAFAWAGLFLIEGYGLWKARPWAEWLTVVATSSFVPLEAYGFFHHPTWPRLLAIVVNLLVIGYLLWKLGRLPGIPRRRFAVSDDRSLVSTREIS